MKKLIFTILCLSTFLYVKAQSAVTKINLMGKTYTVSQKFPPEITGLYLYEQKDEPKILLNKDGTGYFQRHGVPPTAIKYWIDCDEKGVWRKQVGDEGKYQYTLLVQYLEEKNGNSPTDGYDLMGVMILPKAGYVVILGERYKPLNAN